LLFCETREMWGLEECAHLERLFESKGWKEQKGPWLWWLKERKKERKRLSITATWLYRVKVFLPDSDYLCSRFVFN
jgi:hypothetical protein